MEETTLENAESLDAKIEEVERTLQDTRDQLLRRTAEMTTAVPNPLPDEQQGEGRRRFRRAYSAMA